MTVLKRHLEESYPACLPLRLQENTPIEAANGGSGQLLGLW